MPVIWKWRFWPQQTEGLYLSYSKTKRKCLDKVSPVWLALLPENVAVTTPKEHVYNQIIKSTSYRSSHYFTTLIITNNIILPIHCTH